MKKFVYTLYKIEYHSTNTEGIDMYIISYRSKEGYIIENLHLSNNLIPITIKS